MPRASAGLDRALVKELDLVTDGAASARAGRRGAPRFAKVGTILVGLDGSGGSLPALEWGVVLAKAWGAKLHLVSVAPPWPRGMGASQTEPHLVDSIYHEYEEDAERILARASERALAQGVAAQARVERGDPAAKLKAAASRLGADLLVLGSHGHGRAERLMLGSVADKLRHTAPCSVLLARGLPERAAVLGPVDGSWDSLVALDAAMQVAQALGCEVEALHVAARPLFGSRKAKAEHTSEVRGGLRVTEASGSAAAVILRHARAAGNGLVVVGSRGLGNVKGALLGSVGNRVSHAHPGPVLIVRPR